MVSQRILNIHINAEKTNLEPEEATADVDITGRFGAVSSTSVTVRVVKHDYVIYMPHNPALETLMQPLVGDLVSIDAACYLIDGVLHLRYCEIGF